MGCCSCFSTEKVEDKPSKAVAQTEPTPVGMTVPDAKEAPVEIIEAKVKVAELEIKVKVDIQEEKADVPPALDAEPKGVDVVNEIVSSEVVVEKDVSSDLALRDTVLTEKYSLETIVFSAELEQIIDKVWESEQAPLFNTKQIHRVLISPETSKFPSFEVNAKPTNIPSTTEYYFRSTPPRFIVHAILVSALENKLSLLETILKNPLAKELGMLDVNMSVEFEEGGYIQLYNSIGANRFFASGSPLHFAAYMGDLESIKLLKTYGAVGEGVASGSSEQGVFKKSGEWTLGDCAKASGNWQVDEYINQ
ncbi:hypothetical protein HDV01_003343 [Terramyces sp. JEL0728]|nr:hypothetical protein HDV01_003343 [Terramyces sp. JEL0728]